MKLSLLNLDRPNCHFDGKRVRLSSYDDSRAGQSLLGVYTKRLRTVLTKGKLIEKKKKRKKQKEKERGHLAN